MFARIGIMRALNRGHVREFNPSRKDTLLAKKIRGPPPFDVTGIGPGQAVDRSEAKTVRACHNQPKEPPESRPACGAGAEGEDQALIARVYSGEIDRFFLAPPPFSVESLGASKRGCSSGITPAAF